MTRNAAIIGKLQDPQPIDGFEGKTVLGIAKATDEMGHIQLVIQFTDGAELIVRADSYDYGDIEIIEVQS